MAGSSDRNFYDRSLPQRARPTGAIFLITASATTPPGRQGRVRPHRRGAPDRVHLSDAIDQDRLNSTWAATGSRSSSRCAAAGDPGKTEGIAVDLTWQGCSTWSRNTNVLRSGNGSRSTRNGCPVGQLEWPDRDRR
ncbi:hypothetical protein I553_0087 [Mycobacterium xenopi 4042]|uniref:Uncharacterized protein n=1 Tax=Mycobacterium xenopi 4042 TaxID=1299334 RepID=X7YIA7_MYCXE|nr:hypothetical protein I553_0087 [Mycobacterium xenopi 4042]